MPHFREGCCGHPISEKKIQDGCTYAIVKVVTHNTVQACRRGQRSTYLCGCGGDINPSMRGNDLDIDYTPS